MSRFVRPELKKLPLMRTAAQIAANAAADTITVKEELTAGEQRKYFERISVDGNGVQVNRLQTGIGLVLAYLVDWTIKDGDGEDAEVVPIKGIPVDELQAILDGLDTASFTEIKEAIERHELEVLTAKRQKKLTTTTPSENPTPASSSSEATSSSVN